MASKKAIEEIPLPKTAPIGIISGKPLVYLPTKGEYIAKGAAGQVYGYHIIRKRQGQQTDEKLAVKFTSIEDIKNVGALVREIAFLHRLHHPNVLRLIDAAVYQDAIVIVTPRGLGSLVTAISSIPTQAQKIGCMFDALCGLHYLHMNNIIHSDVKPGNILVYLDAPNQYRGVIADLGGSVDDRKCFGEETTSKERAFTISYRPPEGYLGMQLTPANDIWSFGVTLFLILTNNMLFKFDIKDKKSGKAYATIFAEQCNLLGEPNNTTWPGVEQTDGWSRWLSSKATALKRPEVVEFKKLGRLEDRIADRITLALFKRILIMDPSKRSTARELLHDPFFASYLKPTTIIVPEKTCEQLLFEIAPKTHKHVLLEYPWIFHTLKSTSVDLPGRAKYLAGQIAVGISNNINKITSKTKPEIPPYDIVIFSLVIALFILENNTTLRILDLIRNIGLENFTLLLAYLDLDTLTPTTPYDLSIAVLASHTYPKKTHQLVGEALDLLTRYPIASYPPTTISRTALLIACTADKRKLLLHTITKAEVDDIVKLLVQFSDYLLQQKYLENLQNDFKNLWPTLKQIPLGL